MLMWACIILFAPLGLFWGVWLVLVVAGATRGGRAVGDRIEGLRIDVLVPAHNEEKMLPGLIESLKAQDVRLLGRVLVVADHCTDDTAALARHAGFEVLERNASPRGKPSALGEGVTLLSAQADRGAALMVVDADCICSSNLLTEAARELSRGAAVLQAAYILESKKSGLAGSMSVGFGLKNVIRPRGMKRLGLPTQLFGSGMVFRYDVLQSVHFADHLTEDMEMSLQLLKAGVRPVFLPHALVTSPTPEETGAMTRQRLRWEGGQVALWRQLPGRLIGLIIRGQWRAIISLIDWSAPPLAMGVMAWMAMSACVAVLVMLGVTSWWAFAGSVATAAMIGLYLVIGLLALSGVKGLVATLLHAPAFLWWKVSVYSRMARGGGVRQWERTDRDSTKVPAQTPVERP